VKAGGKGGREGELLELEKNLFERFGGLPKEASPVKDVSNRNFAKIEPQRQKSPVQSQKRAVEKDDGNLIPKMTEHIPGNVPAIMKQSQPLAPKGLDDTMPHCTLGQNPMGQVTPPIT
jgi:hypothetical protein